jgi:hypothetical protein
MPRVVFGHRTFSSHVVLGRDWMDASIIVSEYERLYGITGQRK